MLSSPRHQHNCGRSRPSRRPPSPVCPRCTRGPPSAAIRALGVLATGHAQCETDTAAHTNGYTLALCLAVHCDCIYLGAFGHPYSLPDTRQLTLAIDARSDPPRRSPPPSSPVARSTAVTALEVEHVHSQSNSAAGHGSLRDAPSLRHCPSPCALTVTVTAFIW